MKTTRAKFNCHRVSVNSDGTSEITMYAVTSGSPENEEFFKYTPAGLLNLATINPNIKFEQGLDYYIDIIPADQNFYDRLKCEREQLNERYHKLNRFLGTPTFSSLSEEAKELLKLQVDVMSSYIRILDMRIIQLRIDDKHAEADTIRWGVPQ